MTINVGHLFRKRTVRGLSGGIIDMTDEANGGTIIRKGQVVNQERIDELARIEADKKAAATAFAQPAEAPSSAPIEARNNAPGKMEALEKKVESMEGNIAAILELLQKK